jgi:hypothetical protein
MVEGTRATHLAQHPADHGLGRLPLPRLLINTFVPLAVCVLPLGPSGPWLALGLATLVVAASLAWRRGELPDLLFLVIAHWVMLAIIPLVGVFESRDALADVPGSPHEAYLLGMLSTVALAAGLRLGREAALHNARPCSLEWPSIDTLDGRRLTITWAASKALELLLLSKFVVGLPVRQQLGALALADDVVLVLVVWRVFARRRIDVWTVTVLALSLASATGAFHAVWAEPFLVILFVGLAVERSLRLRAVVAAMVLVASLLYLGQWWMAARGGLRQSILAGDTSDSWSPRATRLVESARDVGDEELDGSRTALINRIAYLEYFSLTLDNVPEEQPHTQGERLGEAIRHVLMPRVFFPDKTYVTDSALVERYAGVHTDEGTSIGLSFVAEGYIDFGIPGVVLVSLLVGSVMGLSGGVVIRLSPWKPLGFALALSIAMAIYGFGALLLKLIGHRLTVAIVWSCVLLLLGDRIAAWLCGPGRGRLAPVARSVGSDATEALRGSR